MVLAAETALLRFKSAADERAAAGASSVVRPGAAAAAATAVPVAKKSRAAAAAAPAASSAARPAATAAAAIPVAKRGLVLTEGSASAAAPEGKAVRTEDPASSRFRVASAADAAPTFVPVAKSWAVDPAPLARAGAPLPKPSRLIRPEDLVAVGAIGQQRPGFKQPKWVFWKLTCARKDAKQRYSKSTVLVLFMRHRPAHFSTQPLSTDDIHRAKEKQRLKAKYQDQGHGGGLQAKGVEVGAGLGGRSRFDRLSHA